MRLFQDAFSCDPGISPGKLPPLKRALLLEPSQPKYCCLHLSHGLQGTSGIATPGHGSKLRSRRSMVCCMYLLYIKRQSLRISDQAHAAHDLRIRRLCADTVRACCKMHRFPTGLSPVTEACLSSRLFLPELRQSETLSASFSNNSRHLRI